MDITGGVADKFKLGLSRLVAVVSPPKYEDTVIRLQAEATKAETDLAQATEITTLQKRIAKAKADKAKLLGGKK